MSLTTDAVYRMLDQVLPATAALPAEALSGGERMMLAGYLFAEGDDLVQAVARALIEGGPLLADVPIVGQDLERRLGLSRALRGLHGSLKVLCQRAGDEAMRVQAEVVKDALDVVHHVRSGGDSPFAGARQAAREEALQTAEDILRLRKGRRREVQRRSERSARRLAQALVGPIDPVLPVPPVPPASRPAVAPGPSIDVAPAPSSPRPSPQRRAIQEARRRLRQRAIAPRIDSPPGMAAPGEARTSPSEKSTLDGDTLGALRRGAETGAAAAPARSARRQAPRPAPTAAKPKRTR